MCNYSQVYRKTINEEYEITDILGAGSEFHTKVTL